MNSGVARSLWLTVVLLMTIAPAKVHAADAFTTTSIRGRVVYLAEALERLHGVKTLAESKANTLALESPDSTLVPLVEDKIGHSFRLDERLLGQPMELLVRQFKGSPAVQVIRIHTLEGEQKFLIDYWCDICSIPMYELKPCDCCQGDVRLRKRQVAANGEVQLEAAPK
jgi:hypothetical protein